MGVVQNSINQLFTLAAVGAKLSPGVEKLGAMRDIKKQQGVNVQRLDAITADEAEAQNMAQTLGMTSVAGQEQFDKDRLDVYQSQSDLAQKAYDLSPSLKSYQKMVQAREKVAEQGKAMVSQKEDFQRLKDLVKNYPAMDSTLGEVYKASPRLAGQIAYQTPELKTAVEEYSKGGKR